MERLLRFMKLNSPKEVVEELGIDKWKGVGLNISRPPDYEESINSLIPPEYKDEARYEITGRGRVLKVHKGADYLEDVVWYPLQEVFGKRTTKPLIDGKIALHMKGIEASRVIIGDSFPRTGDLSKPGDAYLIGPNALHRAQFVNLTSADFRAMEVSASKLDEWPPFNPEAGGMLDDKQVNWGYTGGELGCAVREAEQPADQPGARSGGRR